MALPSGRLQAPTSTDPNANRREAAGCRFRWHTTKGAALGPLLDDVLCQALLDDFDDPPCTRIDDDPMVIDDPVAILRPDADLRREFIEFDR
jgi:hypothetical protein